LKFALSHNHDHDRDDVYISRMVDPGCCKVDIDRRTWRSHLHFSGGGRGVLTLTCDIIAARVQRCSATYPVAGIKRTREIQDCMYLRNDALSCTPAKAAGCTDHPEPRTLPLPGFERELDRIAGVAGCGGTCQKSRRRAVSGRTAEGRRKNQ
jgi:hypothetical protein